ncbi:MAG: flagellar hook-length control protein FliK [Pseudomonadota bacterium]
MIFFPAPPTVAETPPGADIGDETAGLDLANAEDWQAAWSSESSSVHMGVPTGKIPEPVPRVSVTLLGAEPDMRIQYNDTQPEILGLTETPATHASLSLFDAPVSDPALQEDAGKTQTLGKPLPQSEGDSEGEVAADGDLPSKPATTLETDVVVPSGKENGLFSELEMTDAAGDRSTLVGVETDKASPYPTSPEQPQGEVTKAIEADLSRDLPIGSAPFAHLPKSDADPVSDIPGSDIPLPPSRGASQKTTANNDVRTVVPADVPLAELPASVFSPEHEQAADPERPSVPTVPASTAHANTAGMAVTVGPKSAEIGAYNAQSQHPTGKTLGLPTSGRPAALVPGGGSKEPGAGVNSKADQLPALADAPVSSRPAGGAEPLPVERLSKDALPQQPAAVALSLPGKSGPDALSSTSAGVSDTSTERFETPKEASRTHQPTVSPKTAEPPPLAGPASSHSRGDTKSGAIRQSREPRHTSDSPPIIAFSVIGTDRNIEAVKPKAPVMSGPMIQGGEAAFLRDTSAVEPDIAPGSLDEIGQRTPASSDGVVFRPARAESLPRSTVETLIDTIRTRADGTVTVALSPEELGHVRLSMAAADMGLHITVAADRSETLDLIRRTADVLAAELESIGFASVSFSFGGGSGREESQKFTPHAETAVTPIGAPAAADPRTLVRPLGSPGSLNIRV